LNPVRTNEGVSVAPDRTVYPLPGEADSQAGFAEIRAKASHFRNAGAQVIVVQGLGFVGVAVAAAIAAARDEHGKPRFFVIGVDLPLPQTYWKVVKVAAGETPIVSPDQDLPQMLHAAVCEVGNLAATTCEEAYALADVIVVDVPLSVGERTVESPQDITIELHHFQAAVRAVGRKMAAEALVLVETTVPAGATEKIVLPILQEERQRRGVTAPLHLAHAYERVMPGPRYLASIRSFFRSFAGINAESARRARAFLTAIIDTQQFPLWELSDTTSSELAKLLENSYRAANIAFIHEWTLLAEQLGVNLFEIVDSIRVRKGTHDNMRYPGFGVGGYCLTKDSLLAQWASLHLFDSDVTLDMTLQALRTNYQMPLHTLRHLNELLDGELSGKTIAVCGVAYLPGVADTRNSPTELLLEKLEEAGARPVVHDPCLATWPEAPHIALAPDLATALRDADGVVLAVPHREYLNVTAEHWTTYCRAGQAVVDAQNILDDHTAERLHAAGCRLRGVGKGHWHKRGYSCHKLEHAAS
jgi:nucleotide sugar dehydrogenase